MGARKNIATVEWEASPADDVIADSVVALLMHAQSSAASIRLTSKPCRHPRDSDSDLASKKQRFGNKNDEDIVTSRFKLIFEILKEQFRHVEASYEGNKATFEIQTDAGLESDVLDDEGKLVCTVNVEFLDQLGEDAKVIVESADEKLAKNVQACLNSIVSTANAVPL